MKRNAIARDIIGMAGLVLLGLGLWYYDPRLCLCTVGTLLLAAAVAGTLRNSTTPRRPRGSDDD